MFRSPFVAIFGEVLYEDIKSNVQIQNIEFLNIRYWNVEIENEDKIICAKFVWVRSVHVLCAVSPAKIGGVAWSSSI